MTRHEMPDLFGRITLVLGDHTSIRSTVATLRAKCAELADKLGPPPADLLAAVKDLAREVVPHFEVEERPEYFGALAEDSPALVAPIAELKAEHQQMRTLLEELESLAAAGVESKQFASRLEYLLARLTAHERRETALLESFFRGDHDLN